MKKLIIEETKTSPYICLDPVNQKYIISGQSFPEDPKELFAPVFQWLNNELPLINHSIELILSTEYFNSSSNRLLLKIFRILEMHNQIGKNINVIWHYSDEDGENDGIIFQRLVNLPITMKLISTD